MSNQNSENREGSNLPDFMSEKNKFSYVEDAETENSWLNNNLHRLMIWVSVIWFAVVVIYIQQFSCSYIMQHFLISHRSAE